MPVAAQVGRKLKVVHLISNLETGGAEMMLCKLLQGLDVARFFNAVVSMTDEGVLGPEIRRAGVSVRALGMKRGAPNARALWQLLRVLREEKPDVLQTWLYHADLLGLLAGRLVGVPAVCWNIRCVPNDLYHYSRLSRFLVHFMARLSPFPDAVIVNSEAGLKVHEGLGYHPRRWEILPNGFDLEQWNPDPTARERLRGQLGLGPEALLIGLVARYSPVKDHGTFLHAAAELHRDHSEAHFALIGRDVDERNAQLTTLIRKLGLSAHVHLMGNRADVARLLPAMDIASLCSISEGFPNVLGEAMACGVPCVATDAGDAARIVGDTGKIVPIRDPKALAGAWREMIALGVEGRRRLGETARKRVEERYDLPAVVAKYEHLYEELAPCAASRVS